MYKDNELTIRPVEERDLTRLWELMYKDKAPEWKKWDAPYFPHESVPYDDFMKTSTKLIGKDNFWAITINEKVYGIVSYYFEDDQGKWLEFGIVIHESQRWGKGIGTRALKLWVNHLFESFSIRRVGLTTWSGNERMIRVGEKLGMKLEGRIRQVRFYEGNYYDSIRMGILREEWNAISK